MAQDFSFLRARWPKLAALASDAKRLVTISPTVSISSMLTFCEWASEAILYIANVPVAEDASLAEKLDAMHRTPSIPQEIITRFENIQAAPNKMRNPLGDSQVSQACLDDLYDIAQWMMRFDSRGSLKGPATSTRIPPEEYAQEEAYTEEVQGNEGYEGGYAEGNYEEYAEGEYDESGMQDVPASPIREFMARFTNGGGANPLLVIIPALIVIALLTWLGFIIAGKNKPAAKPTPTPQTTLAVSALPSFSTPSPSPSPSPTPTPAPEVTTYLQDMTFSSNSSINMSHIHKGRWSSEKYNGEFNIDGTTYDHGLGMFIASSEISDKRATKALVIDLGGMYNTFITSYGAEKNWDFGNSKERGSYRINIKVDGVTVHAGEGRSGPDGGVKDVTVNVTGAQTLTIELTQRKGSRGTLNIVLGDARLVTGGVVPSTEPAPSVEPVQSQDPSEPAPSESPEA